MLLARGSPTARRSVQPVVLGAVAGAAGLDPLGAARLAVHGALSVTAAGAAAKLFAIDTADELRRSLAGSPRSPIVSPSTPNAAGSTTDPPAWSAPLLELRAEAHARWEVRLFAS